MCELVDCGHCFSISALSSTTFFNNKKTMMLLLLLASLSALATAQNNDYLDIGLVDRGVVNSPNVVAGGSPKRFKKMGSSALQ